MHDQPASGRMQSSTLREADMDARWIALAVLTTARASMGYQFQSLAAVSPLLIDEFPSVPMMMRQRPPGSLALRA